MSLPRIIWTYWEQGEATAPHSVQRCLQSWADWNPGWELHVLDRNTLRQYTDLEQRIDFSRADLTVTKRANLIRASLLRTHGGVWADATVMCTQPLETWLPEYMSTGFFAFRNPGRDRLCSNWFLVAEPDNPLMAKLEADYVELFAGTHYSLQNTRLGDVYRRLLKPFFTRNVRCSRLWVSPRTRNLLRVYPYFHFHYCFNNVVLDGGEPGRIWHQAKPFSARPPHALQRFQHAPDGEAEARAFIRSQGSPVHKLNWRLDVQSPYWRGVFDCLEQLRQRN